MVGSLALAIAPPANPQRVADLVHQSAVKLEFVCTVVERRIVFAGDPVAAREWLSFDFGLRPPISSPVKRQNQTEARQRH